MTSPLRATLVLATGSVVTLGVRVITSKFNAILIGPEGYGLYALLLSVLNLGVLVGGLGAGVGLVRLTAIARASDDLSAARDARAAAYAIAVAGGLVAAAVLVLASGPISTVLAPNAPDFSFVIIAPALVLTVCAGIESSTLNGHQLVRAMATTSAVSSVLGGVVSVALVALMGREGVPFAILASSVIAYAVAVMAVRRSVAAPVADGTRPASNVAGDLLRMGASYTTSAIAGTGAQLAVPLLIALVLMERDVGLYRAAAAISIGYLGFLLQAMGQDYFPRASAAYGAGRAAVSGIIDRQLALVLALATPVIFGVLAAADLIVTLLYSPEFRPAAEVLRWQLIGDILKLPAWTLSLIVLAAGRGRLFLGLEVVGGSVLIIATLVATMAIGLTGAGVGYLVTYVVYLPVAWIVVRWRLRVPLSRLFLVPVLLAVAASGVMMAGPLIGSRAAAIQDALFAGGALVAAAYTFRTLVLRRPSSHEGSSAA